MKRQRWQIMISIGAGGGGEDRRAKLEAAARQQGMTLSEWGRRVLFEAAGVGLPVGVSRTEWSELERRVSRLESERKI